jgi:hypothetical protein
VAERETAEEQRERQDAEKSEMRVARQERLGHVEKPKAKNAAKKKTEESKSE